MLPKYENIGTGITARKIERASVEDYATPQEFVNAMEVFSEPWKVRWERALNSFEEVSSSVLRKAGLPDHDGAFTKHPKGWRPFEKGAQNYRLQHARLQSLVLRFEGHEEDSNAGFAARLLTAISTARVSKDEFELAAISYNIGCLWTEWQMKLKWEKAALRGESQLVAGRKNLAERTEVQKHESEAMWRPVRQAAEKIWKQKPALSVRSVAINLKSKLALVHHVDTISRKIKIVRPASSVRRK